ncbi:MAG TPA: zinc-binding alcohol dehydrogenase [Geminicoccaceae bacterium]|jgi:2-desacetyl-2-hydroxyethyl bacteriochlorophyllide A dehydrogenase|nr:zinc-binding alcohol dehydrogenase [Geminicoccaceae bacterium]
MAEARAFWVVAPGRGELRPERLRPPSAEEVLIETRFSGISRGTETLVFQGRVPASQHEAMRAPFQAGSFDLPLKYGYSSVGVVAGGAPGLVGRRVFCLHPHQDRYVVPAAAVIPLPDAVPDARAVLAANMETALNGLWDAAPRLGDRVGVIGAGVVGTLAAALLVQVPGIQVQLIDIDSDKAAVAADLGVDFTSPGAARQDLDLVLHASGAPHGLATALDLAGFEAKIVELSWYGDQTVALPLGEAFHSRRLRLISSQVGALPSAQRARWNRHRRLALALDLLTDPRFDALLAPPAPFSELPAVMAELTLRPTKIMCQIISYR